MSETTTSFSRSNPASSIPVRIVAGGGPGASPVTPLGYVSEQVDVVTKLTPPTGATMAVISVSGNSVRYRDDGTAPMASEGFPVADGATFTYSGPLSDIQFIATSSTAAVLDILYYSQAS